MRCFVSPAAASLALPLLLAARFAVAAPPPSTPTTPPAPKLLQLWTMTDKGLFVTFSDGADGTLSLDSDYATQKQTLFNGASVALFDNGRLVIGTVQGNQISAIAVLAEVNTTDMTFVLAHSKSTDGKTFFDGTVNASTDLQKAFFEGTLTEISADSQSSKSTHIELNLAAPGQGSGTTPGNSTTPASNSTGSSGNSSSTAGTRR